MASKKLQGLTTEERELLVDVLNGDSYKVVIKYLEYLQRFMLDDIARYNLDDPKQDRGLVIMKARHEGALKLIESFKSGHRKLKESEKAEDVKRRRTRKP